MKDLLKQEERKSISRKRASTGKKYKRSEVRRVINGHNWEKQTTLTRRNKETVKLYPKEQQQQ